MRRNTALIIPCCLITAAAAYDVLRTPAAALSQETPDPQARGGVRSYKGYALLVVSPGQAGVTEERIRHFLEGSEQRTDAPGAGYMSLVDYARQQGLTVTFLKHKKRTAPRLDISCGNDEAFMPPDPQPDNSRIDGCRLMSADSTIVHRLSADENFKSTLSASKARYLRIDDRAVTAIASPGSGADSTTVWDLLIAAAKNVSLS